jgi:hypothetical protein
MARFFIVTIQGMRAMARLRSDRKSLNQVARVALAALNQYSKLSVYYVVAYSYFI